MAFVRGYQDHMRPVVILGMHRSGTSMLARMLEACGLFVGATLEHNHEPPLFRRLNDRLLLRAAAGWTQPNAFLSRLEEPQFVAECEASLREGLEREFRRQFLGLHGVRKYLGVPLAHWGWKEPRTSLTLRIWRRLYPEARFLHIVRHPLDVAISLQRRQTQKEVEGDSRWSHPECADLADNLRLWEAYVAAVAAEFPEPGPQFLELQYEALLKSPLAILQQATAFAGLSPTPSELRAAADSADAARTGRFEGGPEVAVLETLLPELPCVRRKGYG